jgi:TonB family protein
MSLKYMDMGLNPSRWRMNFGVSILISAIIHLLIILIMPGFDASRFVVAKPYIEVSLLSPPKLVKQYAPSTAPPKQKVKTGKWEALAPQLPGMSQYPQARLYRPSVDLPASVAKKQELLNLVPEQAFSVDDLNMPPQTRRPSIQDNAQLNTGIPEGAVQSTSAEITWSGLPRRYSYKPKEPVYSSRIEGKVKLKFWVDPQGNVANVTVLRKLDADLEQLAIDYMKRWRFEALKGKEKQELQWGTIDISFEH